MQPVTGPFTTFVSQNSPPTPSGTVAVWYQRQTSSHRQRKPYNLPLDHVYSLKRISDFKATDSSLNVTLNDPSCMQDSGAWGNMVNVNQDAYNRAFKKFVDNLKTSQSEIGAALGERHQSLDMIEKRSRQLYRAFKAIKRLRFGDLANALELKSLKRRPLKSAADALLEYRFGWAPLVKDVSNAVGTLTRGLPSFLVKGTASGKGSWSNNPVKTGSGGLHVVEEHSLQYVCHWLLRARVRGFDPNLSLANELGLVNPVSVAWELVPFSFVVDYFVNVGEYLNGFTDLFGYEFAEQSRSIKQLGYSTDSATWWWDSNTFRNNWTLQADRVEIQRLAGTFPGPSLTPRISVSLPAWRAATSVALLVQQLRRF